MAGTGVGKFSSTAGSNTDNLTVNFAENMAPSNVNNAARELMGHMLDMYEQLGDGYFEFGDGDGKVTFKDFIPKYVSPKKWKEGGYSQERNLPVFHKPEGIGENLTEGAARFVTGFIGPSKFFKAVGLGGPPEKTFIRREGDRQIIVKS